MRHGDLPVGAKLSGYYVLVDLFPQIFMAFLIACFEMVEAENHHSALEKYFLGQLILGTKDLGKLSPSSLIANLDMDYIRSSNDAVRLQLPNLKRSLIYLPTSARTILPTVIAGT